MQCASVSSCAPRLLKHFSCRSFRMMWTTDACFPWYFTDYAVSSGLVFLTQNHIVYLVIFFIRVGTSSSVTALTSLHCSCVFELLEQPVNAVCRPSFVINCLALYPFKWYKFFIRILSSAEPPIFGPCLLWPNGCVDQDATWYAGRPRPSHIVLDGDPAPLPKKGQSPPIFGPFLQRAAMLALQALY